MSANTKASYRNLNKESEIKKIQTFESDSTSWNQIKQSLLKSQQEGKNDTSAETLHLTKKLKELEKNSSYENKQIEGVIELFDIAGSNLVSLSRVKANQGDPKKESRLQVNKKTSKMVHQKSSETRAKTPVNILESSEGTSNSKSNGSKANSGSSNQESWAIGIFNMSTLQSYQSCF